MYFAYIIFFVVACRKVFSCPINRVFDFHNYQIFNKILKTQKHEKNTTFIPDASLVCV